MGIGAKALGAAATAGGLGLTGLFLYPEIGRVRNAAKEGKALKQVLGSTVNFGKWMTIPALLAAVANPVTIAGVAAVGLAGFVLPSFISEIDVTEKKENQGFSAVG